MSMAGKVGTVRVGLNRYKKASGTSPHGSITSKTIIEKEINNQIATPEKITIKKLNKSISSEGNMPLSIYPTGDSLNTQVMKAMEVAKKVSQMTQSIQ